MRITKRSIVALTTAAALAACGSDKGPPGPGGDISLALSTSSLVVAQGSSGIAGVTVARTGGFTGPVALSVDGLPEGVTAATEPAALAGESAALTLTVGAAVAPGDYSLTVRATGTGVPPRTAGLTLTVTPAAAGAFTLAVAPTSLRVTQGDGGTATVTVARTVPFSDLVTVAVEGAPAGVTATVAPNPVGDAGATLTVAASATAPAGDHTLTVRGTASGQPPQTATLALTIVAVTGGAITTEQRAVALDAVEGKASELWGQGATGDAFNQAMAQWLQSRPEFEAAGVNEATSTVWAQFVDGRLLFVVNNRFPEPPTGGATAATITQGTAPSLALMAAEPTELPMPTQARLFHGFGVYRELQAPIREMVPWFTAAGYGVVAGAQGDAHVTTLRTLSGDGFFYFNTHGGAGHSRDKRDTLFAMWTTTVEDTLLERDTVWKNDLDSRRLVFMTASDGERVSTHYAITHRFVEKYMSFGPNSVLYFSVCHSAGPLAKDFIAAMHAKGAGVYFGWTDEVDFLTLDAVRYLVDRLLGANQYRPESPPQRPFPWPEVLEDMRQKGLTIVPKNGAQLVAKPATETGPVVGLLAPSIQYLVADEVNNVLHISGIFGQDPRSPTSNEGTVTIDDGIDKAVLKIQSWTPTEIIAQLPAVGPGSRGNVVVTVRGHPSNPRQLLQWQGTLTYTLDDLGSLTERIEMDLNIRADAASVRLKPGEAPQFGVPSVMGSLGAAARYGVSGNYTATEGGCTTDYGWSGSGTLTADQLDMTSNDPVGYRHFSLVDERSATAALSLTYWLFGSYTETRVQDCGSGPSSFTVVGRLSAAEFLGSDPILIPLDASMNIQPGSVQRVIEGHEGRGTATATLQWGAMTATPAYDPDLPR